MRTLELHHKLHEYIDRNNIEWPSLSLFGWKTELIWAYSLFYFIYLSYLIEKVLIDELSLLIKYLKIIRLCYLYDSLLVCESFL
jgi:hypothetical protein